MMNYCPKCKALATTTTHQYHENNVLIRTEEVCDNCHQTLVVKHYKQKRRKPWGVH